MGKVLWIVQLLVVAVYLMAGSYKAFAPAAVRANPDMKWAKPGLKFESFVEIVGYLEIAGALGLILPQLTGIAKFLTPLAALGLTILMSVALFMVNVPLGNTPGIILDSVLISMILYVFFGRLYLLSGGNGKRATKKD